MAFTDQCQYFCFSDAIIAETTCDCKKKMYELMNEGVKLVLEDSSACEYIKELEKAGTKILVCGTCTTHFGITGKAAVGTVSNMFEIMEMLTGANSTLIF